LYGHARFPTPAPPPEYGLRTEVPVVELKPESKKAAKWADPTFTEEDLLRVLLGG
jgi:hypothetical protein